jgi:serpin B
MTAVLPRPGQESEVAAWLSSDTGITELLAHPGEPDVEVTMPRFAFQSSVDLEAVLKALGVTDAFDNDRADYSGMTQQERLFISAALHQATIEVDEQGTVATAATAIVMDTTSARVDPQRISLDRPFFFVIHDVEARIPVFVGRVADPSA